MVLFTTFSVQHRQIKNIIHKHWNILKNDHLLGPLLPDNAGITYRGALPLSGQIAPNVVDPPSVPTFFWHLKGYYPCRKCKVCLHNIFACRKTTSFRSMSTSMEYEMKHFTTCATKYIVYLITCPCGKQYVGCTIRAFSTRVGEHITSIKKGRTNHSVPRHYLEFHNQNPAGTSFQVINKFFPHWRGESNLRGVSKLETFWIYQLKSYKPFGLNVDWDLNAFINKAWSPHLHFYQTFTPTPSDTYICPYTSVPKEYKLGI